MVESNRGAVLHAKVTVWASAGHGACLEVADRQMLDMI